MERGPKRESETFGPGDKVWIQDQKTKRWSIEATIVKSESERTYRVNDGTREFIRNGKFIRGAPLNNAQDQDGQGRDVVGHAVTPDERDRADKEETPNPAASLRRSKRATRKTNTNKVRNRQS